jgi:nucleotide-binding universal stress UspA family protein
MDKRILVVVGDDPVSANATKMGIEMAQAQDADILFFYVMPRLDIIARGEPHVFVDFPDNDIQRKIALVAQQKLTAASKLAEREGVHSLRATGQHDDPAQCVADAAQSRHCHMIVVATERKNAVMRMVTGSIVPRLLSVATVPVLVCTADSRTTTKSRTKSARSKAEI